MSWFAKLIPQKIRTASSKKSDMPEGLWSNCSNCRAVQYRAELERNLYVCSKCGFHERIGARRRLSMILDQGSIQEITNDIENRDPLKFKDSKKYKDRVIAAQKKTNERDAFIVEQGTLFNIPVVAGAFEFAFIGGSMGTSVGEMFVRGAKAAIASSCPYIVFTASGGARMQEGILSLFQMAKTSAILSELSRVKQPFITVLTDPTMGGVSASLAMLGDVILAEPDALIGFAGPRVIEQTVRQKLPDGFQKSEFLLEKGHIDMIVDRTELKNKLYSLISHLQSNKVSNV